MYFGTTPRAGIPYRPTPPVHRHLAGSQSAALAAPGRPPHRMSPTATDAPSSAFRSVSAASPAQQPIGSPNMSSTQPSAGPRPARPLLRCMRSHDAHVDSPNRGGRAQARFGPSRIQRTNERATSWEGRNAGSSSGAAAVGVDHQLRLHFRRVVAEARQYPQGHLAAQPVAPASRRRRVATHRAQSFGRSVRARACGREGHKRQRRSGHWPTFPSGRPNARITAADRRRSWAALGTLLGPTAWHRLGTSLVPTWYQQLGTGLTNRQRNQQ